jgi:hypothetical protein
MDDDDNDVNVCAIVRPPARGCDNQIENSFKKSSSFGIGTSIAFRKNSICLLTKSSMLRNIRNGQYNMIKKPYIHKVFDRIVFVQCLQFLKELLKVYQG